MKGLRRSFFLLLVIILSFWTFAPFLHKGFFPMHDDTQPARVYEMAKALSYGQFPVRWVGDLGYGYGYPLFNFYAPFPYYIGGSLNLLGFDALVATKIMFITGILLAGITMFLLLDRIAGEMAALVGSLLYMYAPYHAVDIYVRGAVGEFYALAFLPLILLGIVGIVRNTIGKTGKQSCKKDLLCASFGFAGVILSHNILGMITGYFFAVGIFISLLYLIKTRQKLITFYLLILTFSLGLALSAFFILPAIVEKNFTRVDNLIGGASNFKNHFVFIDQLWSSPWGYAGSAPGRLDGMSFMAGKMHILLGLLSIPLLVYFYKRKKIDNFHLFPQSGIHDAVNTHKFANSIGTIYISMMIVFLISVFFMLEQSKFLWNLLPGFPFIQYPWRFLAFTIFSLSIVAVCQITYFSKIKQILIGIFLIGSVVWFNSKYFVPKEYLLLRSEDFTDSLSLRNKISKISDEYLPNEFVNPQSESDYPDGALSEDPKFHVIETIKETPTEKTFLIDSQDTGLKITNITFFPGWKVETQPNLTNDAQNVRGRLAFQVFPGRYQITLKFTNTPIRTVANTISILALLLVIYIIVYKKDYEKIFS